MKGRDVGFLQRVAPVLLAVALAACGGGGGNGDGDEPGPAGGGGGGGQTADVKPDAFSFSPASVDNAEPGGTYFATATVTGFDAPLPARVTNVEGNASGFLVVDGEAVSETTVAAGDTLTLRVILGGDNAVGDTAAATVSVGEAANARTATFRTTVADNMPPAFSIDFPPPKSVIEAETVTLLGRYTENHLPDSIRAFRQDGSVIEGILRDDGHWQMVVDLAVGPNVFTVEMTDSAGLRSARHTVEIVRHADLFASAPLQMTYDQAGNDVFTVSGGDVIRTDLDTRQRTVIASETVGTGEPIQPRRILAVPGQGLLVVEDTADCARANCKLVRIDLATLARSVIADGIPVIRSIALADGGKVLVAGTFPDDPFETGIMEVDIDTGEQALISRAGANGRGAGASLSNSLTDLAYDPHSEIIYGIEHGLGSDPLRRLVYIEYSTGIRGVVSANRSGSNEVGSGAFMDQPVALSVDRGNGAIYVVDGGAPSNAPASGRPLIRILLEDGSRTIVSSNSGNETTALSQPVEMAAIRYQDGEIARLIVADRSHADGLIGIDKDTFERALVPGIPAAGSGADFSSPFALVLDAEGDRLLALSWQSVQAVAIADGVRSEKLVNTALDDFFLGGGALAGDTLWVSTAAPFGTGLASVEMDSLSLGNASLEQRFFDPDASFGDTGSLFVEGQTAYVATDDLDNSYLRKVTFLEDGNIEVTDFVDPLPVRDYLHSGIFRYAPEQIIRAGVNFLHIADPNAENGAFIPVPIAVNDANGYAYDEARQYLYGVGDFREDQCFELARLDFSAGAADVKLAEILVEKTVADCASTTSTFSVPGENVNIHNLFGLALDPERNRLYGLLDSGRNLVAINVAEVLLNEQGLPARVGDATSGETAPLGEAVLISRSENLTDRVQ